jgi:hypothetical protein
MQVTGKEAKHQYQLTQRAGKITERSKSELTTKAWCAANGVSVRVYYYWLRKVREYAAQFLPPTVNSATLPMPVAAGKEMASQERLPAARMETPSGWALCRQAPEKAELALTEPEPAQVIRIEIGKSRITVTADTNPALLKQVCRMLSEL